MPKEKTVPIPPQIRVVSATFPRDHFANLLEKTKPFIAKGHFLYPADTEGPLFHLPSFFYMERFANLKEAVQLIVLDLCQWLKINAIKPDLIFAPADPAIRKIVEEISSFLKKPAAYLEYLPSGRFGSKIQGKDLFTDSPLVLVFNGISTTGRCVGMRLPSFVEKAGGKVAAISAFAKGTAEGVLQAECLYGKHFYAAIQVDIPLYPPTPEKCPLCRQAIPLIPWNTYL